jgi:hypothetical protein
MPELTTASLYARVDSSTFTTGIPMPGSALTLCQSRLYPSVRDFGFVLTLLQDLTQDSATLTGWRRTKRSGEGKIIALYDPGISLLRLLNFPTFFRNPEFSRDLHDTQSGEFLSYAGILHSSMSKTFPEFSGDFTL